MSADRPINADVPAGERRSRARSAEAEPRAEPKPPSRSRPPKRRRAAKPAAPADPGALKVIAALVVVAIVFIVAACSAAAAAARATRVGRAGAGAGAGADERAGRGRRRAEAAEELGYPAFATNNTTRVGGSDPAANAAGVALAVFPSTTAAQRPAAVTLVDEDDWAGRDRRRGPDGRPGAGAGPDLRRRRACPTPTAEALDALDPQGSKATGGAPAFAIGDVGDARTAARRGSSSGGDAAATAAAIADLRDRLFGSAPAPHRHRPAPTSPSFAMPAAAWAARSGDPVLFADARRAAGGDRSPRCKRHPKVPVYVLGPSSAISSDVLREDRQGRPPRSSASPARTRSPTRSPSPATPTATSAGTSTTPATASSSPATTRRSTPPPRRRSRPPAPGGRCCSPTAPLRCRRRCANTSST